MNPNIRNFVIIAHVDHGKSTLADRLLEVTGTVEERRMKAQYLDQLDLERERGITIKMAPVRMLYKHGGSDYILNLIDTPGHSDFSYEVSRALQAVEGGILLVDATQGIQAQTLANYRLAKEVGLTLIGAINKVDLFKDEKGDIRWDDDRLKRVRSELAELLETDEENISGISGKSGWGTKELLDRVVKEIPAPKTNESSASRGLIFDSFYDDHKGVVASVRLINGEIDPNKDIYLAGTDTHSKIKEIGYFSPELVSLGSTGRLKAGEIGYVATGIRDPHKVKIGDTLIQSTNLSAKQVSEIQGLPGYEEARPVVFVSFYPEDNDDFELLEKGLQKLRLNDSALAIEPDQNEVLGRGFKVGFLGRLHFEITAERLRREFKVDTVNTFPSVLYRVRKNKEWLPIVKPEDLPKEYDEIQEPIISLEMLVPQDALSSVMGLQTKFRFGEMHTESLGDRVKLSTIMPLAELISDFDDQLKSATKGLASFSYRFLDYKTADILRVDILVATEIIPGLSRFLPRAEVEREARRMVESLKEHLPRQQFHQSLQASVEGRIVAREDIPAIKKQLGNFGKNGGDRTRKMKLWKKQEKGQKKLEERSTVHISPETFKELLKR